MTDESEGESWGLGKSLAFFVCSFAWITSAITSLIDETYLLLIAAGVSVPVGILHGFGIWLGVL